MPPITPTPVRLPAALAPTRTSLRPTGGFVLLASFALPGLVMSPAAAADVVPPKPAGWSGVSASANDPAAGGDWWWWTWDSQGNQVGHLYETPPEIDPVHLDLFYSTDQVSVPGDQVEFLVSLRRIEDYTPRPQEAPGVKGITRTAASGSVDLRGLVDDIEALRLEDFTGSADDLNLLNLSLDQNRLNFNVTFPAGREVVTFRFSAIYTGAGDDQMTVPVQAQFAGTHYGTLVENRATIRHVEPDLAVVKRGSRSTLTEEGQEVTWTVDVTRPAGNSTRNWTLTDDFSGLADDVDPVTEALVRVDGTDVTPQIAWGGTEFSYRGDFGPASDAARTQTLTYTVRYRGGGDDRLVNTACAVSERASISTSTDPVCATATVTAGQPSASASPTPTDGPTSPTATPTVDPSVPASPTATSTGGTSGGSHGLTDSATPGPGASGAEALPQTGAPSVLGWLLAAGATVVAGAGVLLGSRRGRHSA